MIGKLQHILQVLASRRQRQRFHTGMAITWWLGLILAVILASNGQPVTHFLPLLFAALFLTSILVYIRSRRGMDDPRLMAKEIEEKHPKLQTALLAALDQEPDPATGALSYLQSRLIFNSLESAKRERWIDIISLPKIIGLLWLNCAGIFLFLIAASIMLYPRSDAVLENPDAEIQEIPSIQMTVEPGDVEVEQGSPLTIQASFDRAPQGDVILEITEASGELRQIILTRPFNDPVYQTRLTSVTEAMSYRVFVEETSSPSYSVTTFIKPALEKSVAILHFPEYLEKESITIKDPTIIRAVEGTELELSLIANIPDLSAKLVARKADDLELEVDANEPKQHHLSLTLEKSVRYEIVLTDSAGRRNGRKDVLNIKVIPNKAPVIKVLLPKKNDTVTPIQEVQLEAEIIDETGLVDFGLRYTVDGENWVEVDGADTQSEKRPKLSHVVDLEAAQAEANDVIMWNGWAEDFAPNGERRRVSGDIHIIQVRAFDQEFYQSPPQSGEGEAGAAQKLIEMQKKILDASWNLLREHTELSNKAPTAEDLETLQKSQDIAIQMATQLETLIPDPVLRRFVTDARLEMQKSSEQLAQAYSEISIEPLEPAIEYQQAALRYLYQLMSSKFMLQQPKPEKGQGEPQEQGPKEDLDIKPMEDPYESEKVAQPEMAAEAIEAMEILKRLDDLAKRLRDLNEEIRALQMAMNEAKTEEEKAEIKRRLEQLREQQRELLSDIDELKEKAEEAASDEQQEALDDIRKETQEASESLSDEKLGDALASGSRAEEIAEALKEEFRETSAAKLAEQLRELREDARALERRQEQINESASESEDPSQNNRLSDSNESETSEIQQQQEDYQKLIDALRETAETAESAEPLVAKDLDEALRQADMSRIAEALENMEQPDGEAAAEQAAQGIAELTREIEKAAERILGNEAQALRYARDEIERLAEEMGKTKASEGAEEPGDGNEAERGEGSETTEDEESAQGNGEESNGEETSNMGAGEEPGEESGSGEEQNAGQSTTPGEGNETGTGQGEGEELGEESGSGEEQSTAPGEGNETGEGQGEGEETGEEPGSGEEQSAGQSTTPGEGNETGEGQGEGEEPGEESGSGEGQSEEQSTTPGEGNETGEGQGEGEEPGEEPGSGEGEGEGSTPGQGEGPSGEPSEGQNGQGSQGNSNQQANNRESSDSRDPREQPRTQDNLLTGDGEAYGEWRERIYDLEAVIEDPESQTAVARARKAADNMRKEFRRYAEVPDQERINQEILNPLEEAAREIDARLRELDRSDPLAPVSRDPVPERYDDIVRKYFEELGK